MKAQVYSISCCRLLNMLETKSKQGEFNIEASVGILIFRDLLKIK